MQRKRVKNTAKRVKVNSLFKSLWYVDFEVDGELHQSVIESRTRANAIAIAKKQYKGNFKLIEIEKVENPKSNPRQIGLNKTQLKSSWNYLTEHGEHKFVTQSRGRLPVSVVSSMIGVWATNGTFEKFWKYYTGILKFEISTKRHFSTMERRFPKKNCAENPSGTNADTIYRELVGDANLFGQAFFGHKKTSAQAAKLNRLWVKALKIAGENGNADAAKAYKELTSKRRKNVSMGFYAGGSFHPIRASYDYDEDRVDEGYSKRRPVRKYAKKEKAFKASRRNPKTIYIVKWWNDESLRRGKFNTNQKPYRTKAAAINFFNKLVAKDDSVFGGVWDRAYGGYIHQRTKKNSANPKESEVFNADKLDKLSGIFQGHINGKQIETTGSDYTPPLTARLGRLALIVIKNGKDVYEIKFNGKDAWLSADARKNIYAEGKDARIKNAQTPRKGALTWLGEVQQVNYRTNKSHIENGQLVEYYHELGEVDGIKPNAFLDHDGFILFNGGNYDIDVHGIEN